MKIFKIIILGSLFLIFQSCSVVLNKSEYMEKAENFVHNILIEDYESCIKEMVTKENYLSLIDTTKMNEQDRLLVKLNYQFQTSSDKKIEELKKLRNIIISKFGNSPNISFNNIKKFYPVQKTIFEYTKLRIQLKGDKYSGILEIKFEDNSEKIVNLIGIGQREAI